MLVREVMTPGAEVVRPDTTLQEAARMMQQLDVGPLPVCDGERLVGMLTDRDITIRATAAGLDPKATPVRDVMTPDVIYCYEDQQIEEAGRLMREQQIRRLVVITRDKRLAGMLSLGDLAVDARSDVDEEVLETVSEPARPTR